MCYYLETTAKGLQEALHPLQFQFHNQGLNQT